MYFKSLLDLPEVYLCKVCGESKPITQMRAIRKRDGRIYVYPLCKSCHNARERGHRREYKRSYLKRWRARNREANLSYRDTDTYRKKHKEYSHTRFKLYHDEMLIQGRLRRKGIYATLEEAKELLAKYGRCYPTPHGLTEAGKRECERIRATLRRRGGRQLSQFEIRVMVYEDGFYITPERQKRPYQTASRTLRETRRKQLNQKEKNHVSGR